jgi:hypothetical protein
MTLLITVNKKTLKVKELERKLELDLFISKVAKKRGNQLPVSAARWQHWSPICFATFI